jgi:hypothetical protein
MTRITDVQGVGPTLHMPAPCAALRHALPVVLEGVVGPISAFYLALLFFGLRSALLTALSWSCLAFLRRFARGDRISAVLILDVVLLSVRTVIGFITGNAVLYFLQPMAWSLLVAGVLVGTALAHRPLTQRFAQDFCPFDDELLARPGVQRFFFRVSLLWAAVLITNTGFALWLLLTASLDTFALARTAISWTLTAGAIMCSIYGFTSTMRRDGFHVRWGGLVAEPAPAN